MKIIPLLFSSIVLSGLFAGCSSMATSNDEQRLVGNVPTDFNVAEFSAINPDVGASQAIAAITSKNSRFTDSLTKLGDSATGIAALKASEDAVFNSDKTTLQLFWVKYLNQPATDSLTSADILALKRFNIYGATNEVEFVANYMATQLDSSLISDSYAAFGRVEGRAYRYCKDGDPMTTLRSITLKGVLDGKTKSVDYTGFYFCQDRTNPANLYVVN